MQLGLLRQFDPIQKREFHTPVYNRRRFTHTWVLGKSGVGKSTALVNWALQDIIKGDGIAFFDPHGESADNILLHIPPSRRNDVILYDPSDKNYPISFNILNNVLPDRRPFVASSVVDAFKSIWGYSWGPQLEQFLYNGVAALLDTPDGTLMGLKFLITSPTYRARVIGHVKDPIIKDFWKTDFEELMPEREQRERTLSTLNKIGALISDPAIRNSIGQSRTALDLKDIIDNRKILIVRLPQGQLGIEKASLIGALLMSNIHLTALQRRAPNAFHIYADECHNFGNQTLIEMLSGIRKFGVSLILAHQYLAQLTPEFRAALLGIVGTIVSFRLGAADAKLLAPEFQLSEQDDDPLHAVPPYHAYARVNGRAPLLKMIPTDAREYPSSPKKIQNRCRSEYATPRLQVENRIERFIKNT